MCMCNCVSYMWPICSRLIMMASLRLSESFCLVTPTAGLIAWSLLPSQQFHISCNSLLINHLACGRNSYRRYRKWQGSFCHPVSSLVSRDPHVTGDPAEYNCFIRVCASAVCFKIFINCILVNMTSSQRNQARIWVLQQEKVFFFRSLDDIQCKQDSMKFLF